LLLVHACGGDASRPIEDEGCTALEVRVMGHRGSGRNAASNPYPENTLPSVLQAVRDGAEYVEVDVARSADGALVVMHDDTVDRTTDGSGCVGALTLEQLRALDAAEGTDMADSGVTVPTLQEVLDAVEVGVNVEAKVPEDGECAPPDLDVFAAELLAAMDSDRKERDIFVAAFSAELLERMVGQGRELVLHRRNPERAAELGLDGVNVAPNEQIAASVEAARALGLDTLTVTADPAAIRRALEVGVTYILSDDPEVVRATQRELCPP
jgi:glycerophosphoryl diester phosphodiesterase